MPKLPKVSKSAPLTGTRRKEEAPQAAYGCFCNCGQAPTTNKSIFRQGHDQRFIGQLARDVVDGTLSNETVEKLQLPTEVDGLDIEMRIQLATTAVSKAVSAALADKFDSAARNRWGKVITAKPRKDAAPDQTVLDLATPVAEPTVTQMLDSQVLGASIKVKVGRWKYDATIHGMNQVGKVTAVRYYNKDDKEFVKTEGQFTIVSD